ncbi:Protein Y46E12BL.2 [Aphelenchoides avenae]|nr:Protein Y46E12BL.2 [Aphelenchus avenae]
MSLLGIDLNDEALPIEIHRLWLLPVPKRSIRNAPLEFIMNDVLKMAKRLRARLTSFPPTRAKIYQSIAKQLWGLLASFLKFTSDFQEVFPKFGPHLILALIHRPGVRLTALASIRASANVFSAQDKNDDEARFSLNE